MLEGFHDAAYGRPEFPFFCASNETRAIVRAYNAVCTPGFFAGFNTLLPKLQPKGGADALQKTLSPSKARHGFLFLRSFLQSGN
jgi:hypothetical protein